MSDTLDKAYWAAKHVVDSVNALTDLAQVLNRIGLLEDLREMRNRSDHVFKEIGGPYADRTHIHKSTSAERLSGAPGGSGVMDASAFTAEAILNSREDARRGF